MGIVIRFLQERRMAQAAETPPFSGSATIIILPVVRAERHADTASGVAQSLPPSPQRPTRRRASVQPAV